MCATIKGIYRNGKIELSEIRSDVCEGARVIVAFLPTGSVDLRVKCQRLFRPKNQ